MDALVRYAWLPVFQMYKEREKPSWKGFCDRFGRYLPEKHDMTIAILTGGKLRATLGRMRSTSAPGCDSWRVAELKKLPLAFFDRLACLLNVIEETGEWPSALCESVVSLIDKGEGTSPLKLRPIGVMSVVYRLWAATRVRQVMEWQELWIDDQLHGFRKGHGADDVWWRQALQVEEALLQADSLFGLSLDYGKCFDRIPVHIVLQLALEQGMSMRLIRPLRSLYASLQRRFRVGAGVGKPFCSTNGIIQGCPLSVLLLNLLVNVWTRAVRVEAPAALPCGYADDTGATASQAGPIQQVLSITGSFATVTCQVLNASKSHVWATCPDQAHELADMHVLDESVPSIRSGRLLGAFVRFGKHLRNDLAEKRIKRGVIVADRIRWAPLPMPVRAKLISSLVVPASLYAACVGDVVGSLLNSLTSAVMRAVWGSTRKLRCRDIVLTLFVPGHLVDPRQACIYQAFCILRRQLQKHPELVEIMRRCWHAHVVDGREAPGPIGSIYKHVKSLNWSWNEFGAFGRPGRMCLPLLSCPETWWRHELRDGICLSLWSVAAARRKDMQGLDATEGLDRTATLALCQSKLPRDELGLLRRIMSGSVRLQKRLYDAQLVLSPLCSFCGLCDETLQHCFWECPRWEHARLQFDLPIDTIRHSWPMCAQECGLFLEDRRVTCLAQQLLDEEEILRDFPAHFDLPACRNAIAAHEPLAAQVVWTDGASAHNQDARFRRAGAGIFYGQAHRLNWSGMLPGLAQSNQRAELFAVLVACLRDPRPLEIRTDSEWVCKGFRSWRNWVEGGWQGDHADLWRMLGCELSARVCDVEVLWVKGHAKDIDVQRGRTTHEDKVGNDGADALAVAGAAAHRVPPEVVAAAKARQKMAKQTHEMMVTILTERQKQENLFAEDAPDRGSDMGDGVLDLDSCTGLTDDVHADGGLDCDCLGSRNVSVNGGSVAHGSDMRDGIAIVADCCGASGTELLHASDTEDIDHVPLNDECDEATGTYHGAVQ